MIKERRKQSQERESMSRWYSLLGAACVVFFSSFVFNACSSIECPVQNTVATVYQCNDTLKDTLTVRTRRMDGSDPVLLNQKAAPTSFSLPVSYQRAVDTLFFETKRLAVVDTVWVEKIDMPHFESVDCGVAYFHEIKSVRCTNLGIDSIVITKSFVDYDPSNAHFLIYFKARN